MLFNDLREKKRRKKFLRFQQVTAEAFHFLTAEYGFEHVSTEISADWDGSDQCEIVFSNFPLQFHVTYTLNGKFVGGYFELFERTADGRWKGYDAFDLAFLVQIRCPEEKVEQVYDQNTDEDVERILRAYAGILKTYGSDVLMGDFSILPDVKRIIEEEHRRDIESRAVFLHVDGYPDAGAEDS